MFIFDIEVIVEFTVVDKFETEVIVEYDDNLLVSVVLNAVVFNNEADVKPDIDNNVGIVAFIFETEVIVEYDDKLLVSVVLNAVVFNKEDELKLLVVK